MQIGSVTVKPGQLYLGLAILMALICGSLMKGQLGGSDNNASKKITIEKKITTTPVVVAAFPVHAGSVLDSQQLKVVAWPADLLPTGHTFKLAENLVGKVLKTDLFQGEPVFQEKLAGEDAMGGLPIIIPKGLRAITVAVSEIKGVAGFVQPGDKVDILATFDAMDAANHKDQITKTVLQDVLVIAAAQQMLENKLPTPEDMAKEKARAGPGGAKTTTGVAAGDNAKTVSTDKKPEDVLKPDGKDEKKPDDAKPAALVSSVTLALTPAQAEKLTLAEDTGTIRLVLRGDQDHSIASVNGIRQSQIVPRPVLMPTGTAKAVLPPGLVNAQFNPFATKVELIQGTQKSAVSF